MDVSSRSSEKPEGEENREEEDEEKEKEGEDRGEQREGEEEEDQEGRERAEVDAKPTSLEGVVGPDSVEPAAGANSAEQSCPICLGDFQDKAFIDACFRPASQFPSHHSFTQKVGSYYGNWKWSAVASSCPLCKTPFKTVIHNVKAIDNYEQFTVQDKETPSHFEISINEARRFRYRTTRVPGQPYQSDQSGGSAPTREHRHHHHQQRRQGSRKPATDERRRAVYSAKLRALPLEVKERRLRVRDISAAFFNSNPASVHRLVPWLSRECRVLLGKEHVEFMIQMVMSLIDKVDLESEEFAAHLEPFLHDKTAIFMHEFISFAKSPYDMAAYDKRVRYEWPDDSGASRSGWEEESSRDATSSSEAGPSEMMMQRIFAELTATRWDDSPPIYPNTSPIIVHGSDSEEDNEPTGSQSPPSPTPPPLTPLPHTPPPLTPLPHTPPPLTPPTATNTTVLTTSIHTCTSTVSPSCLNRGTPSLTDANDISLEGNGTVPSSGCVRVTGDPLETQLARLPPSQPQQPLSSVPPSACDERGGEGGGGRRGGGRGGVFRPEVLSIENEDTYEISIHADSLGELDSSEDTAWLGSSRDHKSSLGSSRHSKGKGKRRESRELRVSKSRHRSSGQSDPPSGGTKSPAPRETRQSSSRRHHRRGSQFSSGHSAVRSTHHRHYSRSRSRSRSCGSNSDGGSDGHHCHSTPKKHRIHTKDSVAFTEHRDQRGHRRKRQNRRESEEHRKHRHRQEFHGDHDYSRYWDADCESLWSLQRERDSHHHQHRSRLYSDDYQSTTNSEPDSLRRNRGDECHHKLKGKRPLADSTRRGPCKGDRKGTDGTSERSGKREEFKVDGKLSRELSSLDREIEGSKRELLKCMLRRERLELLHKALDLESKRPHESEEFPAAGPYDKADYGKADGDLARVSRDESTSGMMRELEVLNRAIIDGKRQVLRVAKRMEELEESSSSD